MKLLPCPFCGETNQQVRLLGIKCPTCGAWGPDPTGEKSGIDLWNQRPATRPQGEK